MYMKKSPEDHSRILITERPEVYLGASRQTLLDLRRFSVELGFIPIKRFSPLNIGKAPSWFKLLLNLKDVEILVLAYPYACRPLDNSTRSLELNLIKRISKKCFSIIYVVDLPIEQNNGFRVPDITDSESRRVERELFESIDKILVFNQRMMKRIQMNYGIEDDRFVLVEMLDYGVKQPDITRKEYSAPFRIVYAGNLSEELLGRGIESLPIGDDLEYHFFGQNGKWIGGFNGHFNYHGYEEDPFDVVSTMSGLAHYGLLMRNRNNPIISEYYSYSTTSKFSAYMVSGLPILVQKEYDYVSELVRKYQVGLVYNSPKEIQELVESVGEDQYEIMRRNAYDLGSKLSNGHFFKKGMATAMNL